MADSLLERWNKEQVSRRRFITYAWWATAGLVAAEALGGSLAFLWPKVKPGGFGATFIAGKVTDFPLGAIVDTHLTTGRFYISHVEGGLLALYRKCTHLGCVVPWREDETSEDGLAAQGRFNCPCHGSIFDRYGVLIVGPAPRPMDLFPIEIKDGLVVVDTGTVIQRRAYAPSQAAKV